MKKLFLIAVFTSVIVSLASCEAEAITLTNNQKEQLHPNVIEESNRPIISDDGPGDDVIILIPPKKP